MGSSYLSEVLGGGKGDTLPDVNILITEVVQQINSLKKDVKEVVDDGYIDFKPFVRENDRLKSETQALITQMTETKNYIETDIKPELVNCTEELENLSGSLQEINMSLIILNELSDIYSAIKNASIKLESKEFFECSKLVTDIRLTIKHNSSDLNGLEIFKILSQESTLLYEQLLHQINEIWSSYVSFDIEPNDTSTSIILTVDIQSRDTISEILKAANSLSYSQIEKRFSHTLLNSVINEIINRKVQVIDKITDKATLTIEVPKSDRKDNYLHVFENITHVVEFLKEHLNVTDTDYDFLFKVGSNVSSEFADNLIKNCLAETIPTKSEDLERYKDVVDNAENFHKNLQETGFLPLDCTSLIDYAKNINVLFANKICQSYLEKARGIMKKDLHNMTNAGEVVINNLEVLPFTHRNILKSKLHSNKDVILFPKCQISKSAEELLTLALIIMEEMVKSQDLCAVRLFYTVRNIFEMYSAVVPLHHKKFLETLPQQVGIFHNNCLYFTYRIVSLTCDYLSKCPKILKDHFTIILEEALSLRSLAIETLESHVSSQRNQLVYILRDSGLATLNEESKLNQNSEKNVRQCIRQLQILQNVWADVLPSNVYNRVIGFLLDSFTEEIIRLIIVVEDISSDTATDLVSIFSVVLEKAPTLFADPKEIYRHTKKWQKFNEFVLVIKGSLRDIDDRWSNGMGPLASEFTPDQVKHMIRALFQNSERRAEILSRIK